jgi:hypothetical protein
MKKIKCVPQFSEKVEYIEDNFNERMIASLLVTVLIYKLDFHILHIHKVNLLLYFIHPK